MVVSPEFIMRGYFQLVYQRTMVSMESEALPVSNFFSTLDRTLALSEQCKKLTLQDQEL